MTRNTDEFENLMQGEALAVKQLKSSDSHQKKKKLPQVLRETKQTYNS